MRTTLLSAALALAVAAAVILPPPAPAKDTVNADLSLARDGDIHVDLINGSLTITGHRGENVTMTAVVKGGLKTFKYESDGRSATFVQKPPRFKRRWEGEVDLTLSVPEGVDVWVEGVNMGVEAEGLKGNIEIELVNGQIEVAPGSESVHVETVNGEIRVAGVADGLWAETVNGRIELTDVNGRIEAETVNGSVSIDGGTVTNATITTLNGDIDWKATPRDEASIHCETHGGSIAVWIPADLHAEVHADTFSGHIHSDFREESSSRRGKNLTFEIGSGRRPVEYRLSSFNGSIDVGAME